MSKLRKTDAFVYTSRPSKKIFSGHSFEGLKIYEPKSEKISEFLEFCPEFVEEYANREVENCCITIFTPEKSNERTNISSLNKSVLKTLGL